MRNVMAIVAVVITVMGVMMFGEPAVQIWAGDGAYAKQSNSCYRGMQEPELVIPTLSQTLQRASQRVERTTACFSKCGSGDRSCEQNCGVRPQPWWRAGTYTPASNALTGRLSPGRFSRGSGRGIAPYTLGFFHELPGFVLMGQNVGSAMMQTTPRGPSD